MHRLFARIAAVLALMALVGCGDDDSLDMPKKAAEGPAPEAKIVSVEFELAVLELEVGESRTLKVTVRGKGDIDPAVTWETSDAAIATVDKGMVTALRLGEATITATSASDPTKSATATVLVKAPPIVPSETGGLEVSVDAHWEPTVARVKISGPEGFEAEVTESQVLEDLLPGTYRIEAPSSYFANFAMHSPVVDKPEVEVTAGGMAHVRVFLQSMPYWPVVLRLGEPPVLPLFGTAELEVGVVRYEEFDGPVCLSLKKLPEGVEAEPVELAPGEDSATIRLVSDGTTSERGTRWVHLEIELDGGSQVQLTPLHIAEVTD